MADSTSNSPLQCVVVTPEETVVDTGAAYVVVPLFDGELGVGAKHSPMIGRLGFGELRIRSVGGDVSHFYVDGGFVQVADDVVSVMTNRAKPVAEIDATEAESQLAEALAAPSAGGAAGDLRQRAIDQARGMLRVARKA